MVITGSYSLVALFTFSVILFPLVYSVIKKGKITTGDLTYNIIHSLLVYPIPRLLLQQRQLIPIGNQSPDDMFQQLESGLSSDIVLLNKVILLYIVVLSVWLLIKRGGKLNLSLFLRDKWFYMIMILNIGLLSLSTGIGQLMYLFLFANFLLFGEFERWQLKKIISTSLLLFIYFSLVLIFTKPEVTIFQNGQWVGIFNNPNGIVVIANFTLVLILLAPYYGIKRTKWDYLHISILFLMVVMCESRNGLLTFTSILGIYVVFKFQLKKLAIISVIIAVPLIYYGFTYLSNLDLISLTSNRFLIWEFVTKELQSNLLTGLGADFFSLDNRLKEFPSYLHFATSSYSSFLDYIVFYGVTGGVLITGFMTKLFKKIVSVDKLLLVFFFLFLIPNLFESFFRPPFLSLNNVCYLLTIFIINGSKQVLSQESKPSYSKI